MVYLKTQSNFSNSVFRADIYGLVEVCAWTRGTHFAKRMFPHPL